MLTVSGNVLLTDALRSVLERRVSIDVATTLILDTPWGYAFDYYEDVKETMTVILTDNPCGEYWEDLWGLNPNALIFYGGQLIDYRALTLIELIFCLERAEKGERFRSTPYYKSPLTYRERTLLRLAALGGKPKAIAQKLDIAESTVRNILHNTYQKLGLNGQIDAIRYYGVYINTSKASFQVS